MRIPERFFEERHYLLHVALLSFAIGIALLFLGDHITMIQNRSTEAMDTFLRYRGKVKSEKIAIVAIDEAAFQSPEVGARQPMSRSYLAKVVSVLSAAEPRVIAIDIDLSSAEQNQDQLVKALKEARARNVKVVISYRLSQEPSAGGAWSIFQIKRNEMEISPEMFKFRAAMEQEGFYTGYVNLNYEGGIARKMLPAAELHSAAPVLTPDVVAASIPLAVLSACADQLPKEKHGKILLSVDGCFDKKGILEFESGELERINFTHTFPYYSTGFVLQENPERLRQILKGRVIFLGETFEKSQDLHHTPLDGSSFYDYGMQGVELLAHSANTLIEGHRIRPVPPFLALLIDCIIGFSLGLLFISYGVTRRTALISGGAVIVLAVLVSFPVLALWDHWFDYAATAVGVTIHRMYEKRKATGKSRSLVGSFESRDFLDTLLKALEVTEKKGFVLVAELSNVWRLSKNYPETNALQIARFWSDLGKRYQAKFSEAQVFSEYRITAVFSEKPTSSQSLIESVSFLLKNVEVMNHHLEQQIKEFSGLDLAIGIDRQQDSMVSAIGNASGLAQRAAHYSAKVLATGSVYEQIKQFSEWEECGEIKSDQSKILIYKMIQTEKINMEPLP